MPPSLKNKIVLITGAGSGISRGTSIRLAELGATLALTDINEATDQQRICNKFIETIVSKYKRIDHIFNCAGINGIYQSTADVTDAYWDKMFNTNVKGFFNIIRACIPHLKSGSSFVNITSTYGISPGAGYAVYCATKAAVIAFSKSIALELGPQGIRTNIIARGAIRTPTNVAVLKGGEGLKQLEQVISLGRIGEPEDIADVAAFLFSDEARYMNESVVEVTGGFFV